MTLHIPYTHQCPQCSAYYIPYDEAVHCPSCGIKETEDQVFDDFIALAAASLQYNLNSYGSYYPAAWWVGTFGDHVLKLLFGIFEQHRTTESSKPFNEVARRVVNQMEWGEQEYLKEHLYQIAVKVHEQFERNEEQDVKN